MSLRLDSDVVHRLRVLAARKRSRHYVPAPNSDGAVANRGGERRTSLASVEFGARVYPASSRKAR